MHNLNKRKYLNKSNSTTYLNRPHKHHYADRRTRQDKCADLRTMEQLEELNLSQSVVG